MSRKYVPHDGCPRCLEPTEPHGALRKLADVGKPGERMAMFYGCNCGHKWESRYLAGKLKPGWWSEMPIEA